jgi:DNA-binding PadR family transcriptional regulator
LYKRFLENRLREEFSFDDAVACIAPSLPTRIDFAYNVEQMADRDEFLLGTLEQIVLLAVMQLGIDAYGTTVRDEIERRTGRAVSFGAIYVTLQRLESKGLVTSRIGEPTAERGGRAKRFFQVTAEGRGAIRRVREAVTAMTRGLRQVKGTS